MTPDPSILHPMPDQPRVVRLQPLAQGRENVSVGQFAYYDDPSGAMDFFDTNVLHHYPFIGDRLTIGPFAALAAGTTILMAGGQHDMSGVTRFPFELFPDWPGEPDLEAYRAQAKGDTTIGPDVWVGTGARIMPGVTIGAGAIVAAYSVVTRDVAPYAVVGGNPATEIRSLHDDATIERMLRLAWWDWEPGKIARAVPLLKAGDLDALEAL